MVKRPSPRVLITRPEDRALQLKQRLEAEGYQTLIEPLLKIESLGPMGPLPDHVQAIVLTSAYAVPALSEEAKRLPVFAVGRATAKEARAFGCMDVVAGDADATALAAIIAKRCLPGEGIILHVSGGVVREELSRTLEAQGFDLQRSLAYHAVASTAFSDDLLCAWRSREIDAVMLLSPRTADILVRLLRYHGLASQVDRTAAICVSANTATPCRDLAWREICLAPQPNLEAMIRALEGSIRIC